MLDPACDCEHPELDPPPHRLAQAREGEEHEGLAALSEAPLDLLGDANYPPPCTEVRLQALGLARAYRDAPAAARHPPGAHLLGGVCLAAPARETTRLQPQPPVTKRA